MASVVTAGTTPAQTTFPTLVLGYEAKRTARTVVHDLIGGGTSAEIIAPRPRAGTLRLFYPYEADAFASFVLHSLETTFTFSDDNRPSLAMTYVVAGGDITIALDDESRSVWVVEVPFHEVEL